MLVYKLGWSLLISQNHNQSTNSKSIFVFIWFAWLKAKNKIVLRTKLPREQNCQEQNCAENKIATRTKLSRTKVSENKIVGD